MTNTTRPIMIEHNCETHEVTEREMTDEEFAAYEASQAKVAAEEAEAVQKAADRAALLAQLGITEEQAKLLLG
jgi:hypothetical protein